jgi:hypothetical protein
MKNYITLHNEDFNFDNKTWLLNGVNQFKAIFSIKCLVNHFAESEVEQKGISKSPDALSEVNSGYFNWFINNCSNPRSPCPFTRNYDLRVVMDYVPVKYIK